MYSLEKELADFQIIDNNCDVHDSFCMIEYYQMIAFFETKLAKGTAGMKKMSTFASAFERESS